MEELRAQDARIRAVQPNFVYSGSAGQPATLPPAQKGSAEPKPPAGGRQ
jgi:hypothetical protein